MRISDWSSDVCSSDLVAGNDRRFGPDGNRTGYVERAVEVDQQPRIGAEEGGGVEHLREPPGKRRGADIPGDMAIEIRRAQAQPPIAGWNMVGRMFARSEEHTSELQSLMRIPYAAFCLKKK